MRQPPAAIDRLLQEGLEHHQNRLFAAAARCFADVLALAPRDANAWYLSGLSAHQLGRYGEAVFRIEQAIALAPGNPYFYLNLGNALHAIGDPEGAEAQFRQALALDPKFASAHHNLGNLLALEQREDEAIHAWDQALVCDPQHLGALLALARALANRRLVRPATTLLQRALALRPDDYDTLRSSIAIYLDADQSASALALCERLLHSRPEDADVLACKARACYVLNRFEEAMVAAREALRVNPDHLAAVDLLADTMGRIGDPDGGARVLLDHLPRHRDRPDLYSHFLFLSNYSATLSQTELLAAHRNWDSRLAPPQCFTSHPNVPDPERRLRVGYVSPDFKDHSVAAFLEPVLEHHDAARFEVYAYSRTAWPDATTTRLSTRVAEFRDVCSISHSALADTIATDRIDLLIDLAGHTGRNSLPAFARKPAPVQISWLGYPNTTGLAAIDYRISDAIADPPGIGDAWNSEAVLRLPDCFHCYRPESHAAFDPIPPAQANGHVTFASFNVLGKISDPTLAAWSRILAAVPGARLLLKTRGLSDPSSHERFADRLRRHAIDLRRIELHGHQIARADHLQTYRRVDIALDPFPYNGTTTTCDALWMGVPVICLLGNRHSARVSASLLGAVGLPDLNRLIAHSDTDYVSAAIALANDPERLARLHRDLRAAMQASPLMDATRFTRHLETLYRQAWRRWCASVDQPARAP